MKRWKDRWKRGLVLLLTVALVGHSARYAMLSVSAEEIPAGEESSQEGPDETVPKEQQGTDAQPEDQDEKTETMTVQSTDVVTAEAKNAAAAAPDTQASEEPDASDQEEVEEQTVSEQPETDGTLKMEEPEAVALEDEVPDKTAAADEPDTDAPKEETEDQPTEKGKDQPLESSDLEEVTVEFTVPVPDEDLPDNEELFEGYIEQILYGDLYGDISLFGNVGGERLTGNNRIVYEALKGYIKEIASGERTSTEGLVINDLSFTKTAAELGEVSITEANAKALAGKMLSEQIDTGSILQYLLMDCPYELYWFDKTDGMGTSYTRVTAADGLSLTVKNIQFSFTVAPEYGSGYAVSNTKLSTAQAAANCAKKIVEDNKEKSDYDKLLAYKDEICKLVAYNHGATGGGVAYGNPWQLIWVFDGDSKTDVVCEGYSKAFQYLCDLSTFRSNDTRCYTVTGMMGGGTGAGGHMWNIVTLGGQNYLVDITNCDENSIGSPDLLFLAGTGSGNAASGYTFRCGSTDVTYTYDDEEVALLGDVLTLASSKYEKKNTLTISGSLTAQVTYGDAVTDTVIKGGSVATDGGVSVDGTFQWSAVTSYGDAGKKTLKAVFVPADSSYDRVTGLDVTVTVSPKSVTPTIEVASGSYEYTGSAVVPGSVTVKDGAAVIPASEYVLSYENNTNVGTATVKVTDRSGGNYNLTEQTKTFQIAPKNLSGAAVSVQGSGLIYNGTEQTPGVTVTLGGRTLTSSDYTVAYQNNTNAGTATVTVTGTGNYIGTASASFQIAKRPVTAEISAANKEYDGTVVAAVTGSVSGLNGESGTITGLTGTFSDKNVGEIKTVTVSGGTVNAEFAANYEVTIPKSTTAKITPKSIKVTANAVSKTYGDPDPKLTYTVDGLVSGDTLTGSLSRKSGEDVQSGGYEIEQGTLTAGNNYTITFDKAVLTINPADCKSSVVSPQNILTGLGSFIKPVFKGVENKDVSGTITYSYGSSTGLDYQNMKNVLAGLSLNTTGTITYSFTTSDPNYSNPPTGTIAFTIKDVLFQAGEGTATADNAVTIKSSPVYGDSWSDIVKLGSITAVAGEASDNDASHFTLKETGIPNAGEQTFTVVYNGTLNEKTYTNTTVCTGKVTIAKRVITVSAGSGKVSKTYDGKTTAGTLSGSVNVVGILGKDTGVAVQVTPAAYTSPNVGGQTSVQAALTISGDTDGNYQLSSTSVTLPCEIFPKTITPSADFTGTGPYTYTGEAITPRIEVKDGSVLLRSTDYTLTWSDHIHAGTAKVTISPRAGGNYTWTVPVERTFTIEKADYTGTKSANLSTRYGREGTFDLTGFLPEGYQLGTLQFEDNNKIFQTDPAVKSGAVTYTLVSDASLKGKQAVITIPVTETRDYKPFDLKLTVTLTDKMEQSGFGLDAKTLEKIYGDNDFVISVKNAVQGSRITYTSSDPAVASVDGNGKIHILKIGTTVITAEASETEDYMSASAACTLTVAPRALVWDVSGLSAVDKDGTISGRKASLYGELRVSGILKGDDAAFICPADQLTGTYAALTPGDQKVTLTWTKDPVTLQGTKSGNYTMPQNLPEITGRINAVSGGLPTPPESSKEVQYQLEMEKGISGVPEVFKGMEDLNTPVKIDTQMRLNLQKASSHIEEADTEVYDVVLMINISDGGWQEASKENFPSTGLTITLPYPEGTGRRTHDFMVCHLFTEDMNGHSAGETEYPAVTKTADGIRFKVYGLSPISVGWTDAGVLRNPQSGGGGNRHSSGSDSSSGGNAATSQQSPVQSAATADESPITFYAGMMILSAAGLAYICAGRKRRKIR